MKLVALISGGKDSCFNMMHCVANGHEIVALANLKPPAAGGQDEMDSFMYQTVGHDIIDLYSECMQLPMYRGEINGKSKSQEMSYTPTVNDEVEDLFELLRHVKAKHPDIQGVAVGAILSNYQRVRVENVCSRLNLTSVAYLWRRDQAELMDEMIECELYAILIKVASIGLKRIHLGKSLADMRDHLHSLSDQFGAHICGEGGEFESLTLDCPLFKKRIVIDEYEEVVHSNDAFAIVAYWKIKRAHVEDKDAHATKFDDRLILILKGSDLEATLTEDVHKPLFTTENVTFSRETLPRVSPFQQRAYQKGSFLSISGTRMSTKTPDCSIEEESASVLSCIQDQLSIHEYTWDDVVLMTVYVDNMSLFGRLNTIYGSFFGLNPPPRVTVQARLPKPYSIQIDCMAFKHLNWKRNTMHVQGISYWAPANIGPYSQATQVIDQIFFAGQIGLIPATMQMPGCEMEGGDEGEWRQLMAESIISLKHVASAVSAMDASISKDLTYCICYLSKTSYIVFAKQYWNSQNLNAVPALFIAVPFLPRGAKIEWHVVCAHPTSTEYAIEKLELSDEVDETSVVIESTSRRKDEMDCGWHLNCLQKGTLAIIQGQIKLKDPTEEISVAQSLKQLLLRAREFLGEIKQLKFDCSNILGIRVFYVGSLVSEDILSKAFDNELALVCSGPKLPAIILVPVDGIDEPAMFFDLAVSIHCAID